MSARANYLALYRAERERADLLEAERDAAVAAARELVRERDVARDLCEALTQEARQHSMEARCYRSIVCECYQIATGATGEPGTWNGAKPIRRLRAELDAAEAFIRVMYAELEGGHVIPPATNGSFPFVDLQAAQWVLSHMHAWIAGRRDLLPDLVPPITGVNDDCPSSKRDEEVMG